MGVQPGEVFIHRNIANLVNNVDLSVITVINYAIRHLKVKHVIVCGHYNCGGVQPADLGVLNPWLRNTRDVYRLHKDELHAIEGLETRYNRLVELNVQEQCIQSHQKCRRAGSLFRPGLAGVFDIHTGRLIDLKIDFPGILKYIMEIYKLY